MTGKQRELILRLARVYEELSNECQRDESFHELLTENNDLFPVSLDEMAAEWYIVANKEEMD